MRFPLHTEQTIKPKIDTVEMVADTTKWLNMKYKTNKQDAFDLQFHDDQEVATGSVKRQIGYLPASR